MSLTVAADIAARPCNASEMFSVRIPFLPPRPDEGEPGCTVVVYVWSSEMPLSNPGLPELQEAAAALDLRVVAVSAGELYEWQRLGEAADAANGSLAARFAEDLIAAGAMVHHPAVIVYRDATRVGHAIVGYKTASAYASILAQRFAAKVDNRAGREIATAGDFAGPPAPLGVTDISVPASPGAFFRHVPGWSAVAFTEGAETKLLRLNTGELLDGPGYYDLIPSPDGLLLVSPGKERVGLHFFETAFVLRTVRSSAQAPPLHVDSQMQDHYPSIGLLGPDPAAPERSALYRVMTSWASGVIYRDYQVSENGYGSLTVRPAAKARTPCRAHLSLAVIAPDGHRFAARDEASGTTKVFAIDPRGACEEVLDLGVATGKVSWSANGEKLAYSIPTGIIRDGTGILWTNGESSPESSGTFVLDLEHSYVRRITDTDGAARLHFPDFVGDSAIMVLLPVDLGHATDRFRLVCCL